HIIVGVKNLKKSNGITTLAWDMGNVLSDVLFFEGEVIIGYEGPRDRESFGYDHSYCLVFSNR
ncbi:MAG: site-specific DNA-methyltransferase, partial [Promethearchaeota archaeon]